MPAACCGIRFDRTAGVEEGGREIEGGRSIEKVWVAGGTEMEGVRQGRKEESRQSGRRRKGRREDAREGGGWKRGSAPRTKLKGTGCNSSDLKTILY